jgi:uncharacterized protein (DUF983 family)
MPWTEENEAEFQRQRADHFADLAREDEEQRRRVALGERRGCPQCGSHRYVEATYAEHCDDCDYEQTY